MLVFVGKRVLQWILVRSQLRSRGIQDHPSQTATLRYPGYDTRTLRALCPEYILTLTCLVVDSQEAEGALLLLEQRT